MSTDPRRIKSVSYLAALAVCALGATDVTAQAAPAGFANAWSQIERSFHGLLGEEDVVGGTIAFVRGSNLLGLSVHGFADKESGREVDERTIYHWASITKTLTSIAIMQLRDRGMLDLDDPIVRYVPELEAAHNPFGPMEQVTIRHLLSHSAGFRSSSWPWGGGEDWHPHEPTEWSQLVAMMPYTEVEFEPGSRWQYSNPGIIFLGRVIESLSGDDFETYMEKNVLRPLGMRSAYYDTTPYHLLQHRSNNYNGIGDRRVPNGLDFDTGITTSNGGLNASVQDMAQYLAFLLNDAQNPAARAVLDRTSLEEMWRAEVPIGESDGVRTDMALGYFLLERNGTRVVGHTGSQMAFRSFFYIHPETGAGMIAVLNSAAGPDSAHPDTGRILAQLRDSMMDTLLPLFEARTSH